MKNKDLIALLQQFDLEKEVLITDGYHQIGYSTNEIEIQDWTEDEIEYIDIGIGVNEQ